MAQGGRLGVEAGRAVAAAEDAPGQVFVGQGEHAPVLLEGPAPGDNLVPLDRHLPSPLASGAAPVPHRRFSAEPQDRRVSLRHFTPPVGLASFTQPSRRRRRCRATHAFVPARMTDIGEQAVTRTGLCRTTAEEIRAAVVQRFAQVARSPGPETKFPVGPASAKKPGHDPHERMCHADRVKEIVP